MTENTPTPAERGAQCSNPECPLARAHSGPCAPKDWRAAQPSATRCDWPECPGIAQDRHEIESGPELHDLCKRVLALTAERDALAAEGELLAEARRWPYPDERNPFKPAAPPSSMVQRLADALEAVTAERDAMATEKDSLIEDAWRAIQRGDALAAILAEALDIVTEAFAETHNADEGSDPEVSGVALREVLSKRPADALAAHDARVLHDAADRVRGEDGGGMIAADYAVALILDPIEEAQR